jgi:hypothetical protein
LDPESEQIPDTEPVQYQELVPEPDLVQDSEPEPLFSSNDLRIWVLPGPIPDTESVPDPEPVPDLNKSATLLKTEKLKKNLYEKYNNFYEKRIFPLGWHVTFPFLES